jgi:SAM-dependent methyltransferase
MSVFGNYGRTYDLLYAEKDYAAEAAFVMGMIEDHPSPVASILDLGCGSGLHAEKFAAAGYAVAGVDRSPSMLELARRRRSKAGREIQSRLTFLDADIRDFDLGRQVDAVSSLFHVMSYMPANEDIEAAFQSARRHLTAGGIFIFDFWYGPAVLHLKPSHRLKVYENQETKIWRFAEPVLRENENIVDVSYRVLTLDKASGHVEETAETHRMRYFFKPELTYFLKQSGFKLKAFMEWMTGGEPGMETWNVVCMAEAH